MNTAVAAAAAAARLAHNDARLAGEVYDEIMAAIKASSSAAAAAAATAAAAPTASTAATAPRPSQMRIGDFLPGSSGTPAPAAIPLPSLRQPQPSPAVIELIESDSDDSSPVAHHPQAPPAAATSSVVIELDGDSRDAVVLCEGGSSSALAAVAAGLPASPVRTRLLSPAGATTASPSGAWPKQLRPFVVQVVSAARGAYPHLHTAAVTVWNEVAASGVAPRLGTPRRGGRSGGKSPFSAGTRIQESELGLREDGVNLRFGFAGGGSDGTGSDALGRVPMQYARILTPLLEAGLISLSGTVVGAASTQLHVGSDLLLSLAATVHKPARRYMRYTPPSQAAMLGDGEPPGAGTGDGGGSSSGALPVRALSSTPRDRQLRLALYELCYLAANSKLPPRVPTSTTPKPPAPPTVLARSASAASAGDTAAAPGGGVSTDEARLGVADNAEEAASAADVSRILGGGGGGGGDGGGGSGARTAALQVAPLVPLAEQPAALCNMRLRPYQLQAISWMTARELGTPPTGTDPAEFVAALPPGSTVTPELTAALAAYAARGGAAGVSPAAADAAVDALVRQLLGGGGSGSGGSGGGGSGARGASFAASASMWQAAAFRDGTPLYINPYTRSVSITPPPPARPCRGGILADEMGLGKTVELCSLVLAQAEREAGAGGAATDGGSARKRGRAAAASAGGGGSGRAARRRFGARATTYADDDDDDNDSDASTDGEGAAEAGERAPRRQAPSDLDSSLPWCRATLVVCPMSMMGQWRREALKYTTPAAAATGASLPSAAAAGRGSGRPCRVLIHYGAERARSGATFADYDLVVTSYGTLASEYDTLTSGSGDGATPAAGRPAPPLYAVAWNRVALDEAHIIRNRTTRVARACYEVEARYRWALTGTPIQNSLQDLYSLLHFLRHEPWCDLLWWKRVISEPYERKEPLAVQALQAVLQPLLLRRTKAMQDVDGSTIGDLAPANITVVRVPLAPPEREFYDQLYKRSKLRFQGYVAAGNLLAHYAQILVLLLRLRQACLHPYLVLASGKVGRVGGGGGSSGGGGAAASAAAADDDDGAVEVAGGSGGGAEDDALFSAAFLQSIYQTIFVRKVERTLLAPVPPPPAPHAGAPPISEAPLPPGAVAVRRPTLTLEGALVRAKAADEALARAVSLRVGVVGAAATSPSAPGGAGASTTSPGSAAAADDESAFVLSQIAHLAEGGIGDNECPVCLSAMSKATAVILVCGHLFCRACAAASLRTQQCPVCRAAIAPRDVIALSAAPLQAEQKVVSSWAASLETIDRAALRVGGGDVPWRSSTKLDLLLTDLQAIARHNAAAYAAADAAAASGGVSVAAAAAAAAAGAAEDEVVADVPLVTSTVSGMYLEGDVRVVVFSSFTFMLDLAERVLRDAGIAFARLDGSMSQPARESNLVAFKTRRGTFVLLISLKAGGLGLNLTEASIVYLLDPWVRLVWCAHNELLPCVPSFIHPPTLRRAVEPQPGGAGAEPGAPVGADQGGVREAVHCGGHYRGGHAGDPGAQGGHGRQCAVVIRHRRGHAHRRG